MCIWSFGSEEKNSFKRQAQTDGLVGFGTVHAAAILFLPVEDI